MTRKITIAVAQMALGSDNILLLGNLDAKRDWGHAKDYVEGMWQMMQYEKPEDFVLATGITVSVRDFVKMAFNFIGVELKFEGEGIDEKATVVKCNNPLYQLKEGRQVVGINEKYFRPTEVDLLIGDASKAEKLLGWKPKYSLSMLVEERIEDRYVLFAYASGLTSC